MPAVASRWRVAPAPPPPPRAATAPRREFRVPTAGTVSPPPPTRRARPLPLHRRVRGLAARQGVPVAGALVDELLREPLHRVTLAQVGAGERLERQQRGGDAVARRHEARVDDVARLLAAQRPPAPEQLGK